MGVQVKDTGVLDVRDPAELVWIVPLALARHQSVHPVVF
jgi:hypothetical protein